MKIPVRPSQASKNLVRSEKFAIDVTCEGTKISCIALFVKGKPQEFHVTKSNTLLKIWQKIEKEINKV